MQSLQEFLHFHLIVIQGKAATSSLLNVMFNMQW